MFQWRWMPDRKWLASGGAGLIAWALTKFIWPDMPAEEALAIGGTGMMIIHYLIPASISDVLKRINDKVKAAMKEKETPDNSNEAGA